MASTTRLLQRSAPHNNKLLSLESSTASTSSLQSSKRRPRHQRQQQQQSDFGWLLQQVEIHWHRFARASTQSQGRMVTLIVVALIAFLLLLWTTASLFPQGTRHHHIQESSAMSFLRQSFQQKHRSGYHYHNDKNNNHRTNNVLQPTGPTLRQVFEQTHPPDDNGRIQQAVQALRVDNPGEAGHPSNLGSDLRHCPETPPMSVEKRQQQEEKDEPPLLYPETWPLKDLLLDWHPNNVQLPQPRIKYQSLCILDWNVHSMEQIQAYRQAEIPFVLRHQPDVMRAAERWNSNITTTTSEEELPYLMALLDKEPPQRNEYAAQSNHLPFWRMNDKDGKNKDQPPPTQNVDLTIRDWWKHANALDQRLERVRSGSTSTSTSSSNGQNDNATTALIQRVITTSDHYYFRFAAAPNVHTYMYDELPLFHPQRPPQQNQQQHHSGSTDKQDPDLFMVEPKHERGINCRFGMVGSRADSHFDPSRNWIVVLGGLRRYILSPPQECPHLNLHPLGHMSARHAADDWGADPHELEQILKRPPLSQAQALQVLLQPGDALYLPTSWFHFIVSLTTSFQCNARSGTTQKEGSPLHRMFQQCGFDAHM